MVLNILNKSDFDVLVTMGAGNISSLVEKLKMNTLSNNRTKIFVSLIISCLLFILVFKFQTQYNQKLNQKIKISADTLYTDKNKV